MSRNVLFRVRPRRGFTRDESGLAAIEFALIMPFLLLLVLGATDLTEALSARRKMTLAANAASDLISQVKEVDGNYVNNVFMATSAMIAPFDDTKLTVVISSVVVDANGSAKVAWSQSKNKAARKKDDPFPLPADLVNQPNLVVAEVTFSFSPTIGYALTGGFDFSETTFAKPRPISASATGVKCTASGC